MGWRIWAFDGIHIIFICHTPAYIQEWSLLLTYDIPVALTLTRCIVVQHEPAFDRVANHLLTVGELRDCCHDN